MQKRTDNSDSSRIELSNSVEWFKQAVAQMKSLDVMPCPKNYSIWYEYYSGRIPELCKDLDRRLEKGETYDDQLRDNLYQHYFNDNAQHTLCDIRNAIRDLLAHLASELSELGVGMESYENVLNSCVEQTSSDMDVKAIRSMVEYLLAETKNCRSANQKAIESVSQHNDEIDAMRETLKKLSEEVMEDALTGVANRRALDQAMEELLSDQGAEQQDCLLIVDIDHFKAVNDEFGHVVGDRVLRFIAEMLKRSVKGKDFIARFGGEEFVVILPETNYQGGLSIARSILKAVSSRRLTVDKNGKALGRVTLSAGLCCVKEDDSAESLLERADDMLYRAKQSGRNTVVGEFD